MAERPILKTERLILRPFTLEDAPEVQRLAGAREVAATTLNIPHPYPDGAAEAWINSHQANFEAGRFVNYAITRRDDGVLLGSISLGLHREDHRAEMGYWVGVPYWNQGYTSEAAVALIRYSFETLGLNRIYATHLASNPASGRVMQKAGMTYEGTLRQHLWKWGQPHDMPHYGILKSEYNARH